MSAIVKDTENKQRMNNDGGIAIPREKEVIQQRKVVERSSARPDCREWSSPMSLRFSAGKNSHGPYGADRSCQRKSHSLFRLCVLALTLFVLTPSAQAAFPATWVNESTCSGGACTEYRYWHTWVGGSGVVAWGDWFSDRAAACSNLFSKVNATWPSISWGGGYLSGPYCVIIRGSLYDYNGAGSRTVAPIYSCPETADLSGATCTCKAGYLQNAKNNGCYQSEVVDVDRVCKSGDCPKGFGNPIYPLTGSKKEAVNTGLTVGGRTLTLTYDSARQTAASAAGIAAKSYGDAPSFGALWLSSLHRNLVISPAGFGIKGYRGDGSVVSFRSQSGVYVPDADSADQLTSITGGYRYVDAINKSIETYNSSGQFTGLADIAGNTLTLSYSTAASASAPAAGYLMQVTDNTGRSVGFEYTLPSGGVAATDGRVSKIINVAGQAITVGYTVNGNLVALIWEDGKTRQFLYENAGLPWALTGVVDENNSRLSTFDYDSAGRAISTERAGGVDRYSANYAAPQSIVVTEVFDPTAQITYRYREWQTPASIALESPKGQSLTLSTSTVLGAPRLTGMSQPAGSGCMAANNASLYDAAGNVSSRDDFQGRRTCYSYDSANRETVRVEGLATSVACSAVTPGGATLPTGARKITTSWHPDWRLSVQVNQPSLRSTTVYHGQPDPFNSNATASCTTAVNLPNGKPMPVVCKQVEQALLDNGSVDATVAAKVRTHTYDVGGRLLTSVDENSRATNFSYYSGTAFTNSVDPGDPDYEKLSLLLHGNGSAGIVDDARLHQVGVVTGGVALSAAQSKFGSGSIYFDGNASSYISYPAASTIVGTGNLTIEGWIYPTATATGGVYSNYNASSTSHNAMYISGTAMTWYYNGGMTVTSPANSVPTNQWTHFALVKNGSNCALYINGAAISSATCTNSIGTTAANLRLGNVHWANYAYKGYLDDFRITQGVARYTTSFTPPTLEFPSHGPLVHPADIGHTTGDLQSITNPAGHVTQYTQYDRAGRVRQMIDPKGVVTDITYTPRGWVSTVTATAPGGAGRTTSYTYDNVGQLTGVAQPDGTTLSYAYDAAHRLVGVTDAKGNSVSYTLDNTGNRIGEDIKDPTGVLQRSISRSFDALNRVQQVTGAAQ